MQNYAHHSHARKLITLSIISTCRRLNSSVQKPLALSFTKTSPPPVELINAIHSASTPLIILHGLFGSKQNWRSLTKSFAQKLSTNVYAIDLRNHGDSPHNPDMSISSMSQDVSHFLDTQNIEKAHVLGHSMGGKVAMCLAIREKRVSSAIIVDMAPDSKKPNSLFEAYVKSMQRIDQAHVKSLIEADILLKPDIPEPEIRQFLLTNLKVNDKGVFKFRLNLDAIDKQMYKLWQFGFNEKCLKPVLFVAGVKSSYITRNMYTGIKNQFVNAEFHEMETGHW